MSLERQAVSGWKQGIYNRYPPRIGRVRAFLRFTLDAVREKYFLEVDFFIDRRFIVIPFFGLN